MNRLIVVNYEGENYKTGNLTNLRLRFNIESGLEPSMILDQPSREELFEYFQNV